MAQPVCSMTYFVQSPEGSFVLPYPQHPQEFEDVLQARLCGLETDQANELVVAALFDILTAIETAPFCDAVIKLTRGTRPDFNEKAIDEYFGRPDFLRPTSKNTTFYHGYLEEESANLWTPHMGNDNQLILVAPAHTTLDYDRGMTVDEIIYRKGVVMSIMTAVKSILGSGIRPRYRTDTDKSPFIEVSYNDLGRYLRKFTGLDQ